MNFTASNIEAWFLRKQLRTTDRIRIYSTLAMLLDNNALLVDALGEMYAVFSEDGQKAKRVKAVFLYECRTMVSEGKSFSDAIRPWVSKTEAALIAAGEASGDLRGAFRDALKMLKHQKAISGAIFGKPLYALSLIGILCYLLHIVDKDLVPSLSAAAPPETWTGSARVLYLMSQMVSHYGLATLVFVAALLVAIPASFPRLCGNIRYRLDKVPPWSVYRMIVGALWLHNTAVLIRSGVKQHDALHLLAGNASAYLRERIEATIHGTTKGLNFGAALEAAEFDFPDREAVRYLRLLANREGFDEALESFSEDWLEASVAKVSIAMNVFFYAALLAVCAVGSVVITAGTDIQNMIEQDSNQHSR